MLQREIWGYGEISADFPYPARALFAISESGGLVSAAFVEGRAAGFTAAWLGRSRGDRQTYLHSQLVGVLSAFRGLGIAFCLKLHQREFALREDVNLIRWTFDPLQAANANLNIRKLGVICASYEENYYGELNSHLGRGTDSDRLWADWHVRSHRVSERLAIQSEENELPDIAPVNYCSSVKLEGFLLKRIAASSVDFTENKILIEVPSNFDLIRRVAPELASEWRSETRKLFKAYLAKGYVVDNLFLRQEDGQTSVFYLLKRRPLREILSGH